VHQIFPITEPKLPLPGELPEGESSYGVTSVKCRYAFSYLHQTRTCVYLEHVTMNSQNATNRDFDTHPDANPDPITGQPGAHPVGTGLGAVGAGAVGAAVGGLVGGPVGAVVGAAVGAVGGGLAGKSIAEQVDPTVEDAYWRENYQNRPYVDLDYTYDDYSPAYRTGYEGYLTYSTDGLTYADVEPRLRETYEQQYTDSRLGWEQAQYASRDAWDRLDEMALAYAAEDDYWRENYTTRPYWDSGYDYDDYAPAYRMGYESYSTYADQGMTFSQAEPHLRKDYESRYGDRRLGWDKAKYAIQDTWHRLESAVTGDDSRRM